MHEPSRAAVSPSALLPMVTSEPGGRPPARLPELDALRGMAAVGVMIFHFYLVWHFLHPAPPPWLSYTLLFSPIRLVLTGKTTLLFFVLSGFVLAYPYFIGRAPDYRAYVLKRLLRLYVPYAVALVFAFTLMSWTANPGAFWRFPGFPRMWANPVDLSALAAHLALVAPFDAKVLNPPIWSLVHEIRLSLAIPLIALLVARLRWGAALGVGLVLAALSAWAAEASPTLLESWAKTASFALMFVLGALIAKNLPTLRTVYRRVGPLARAATIGVGVLAFGYSEFVFTDHLMHSKLLGHVGTAFGGAVIVALAVCSPRLSGVLRHRAFGAIGKVPYGIYLYHLPVTFALLRWTYPIWRFSAIVAVAAVVTLLLAWASYRYVEQPIARLAGRLTKGLRPVRAPRPALESA